MDILIKASQLIMSLSILVVLHELGHFIPAKLFKTRVEKFYLFFDPWFSLIKKKIGDTEYGVGWLPLGGYVKISGMVDESMDKDQLKKDPEKWEFRAKPTWQRLVIMLGGVTVNLFLGIFIYSMTLYFYGDRYLPNQNLSDGVWCTSELAEDLGFKNGDKIIRADGIVIDRFEDVLEMVLVSKKISVLRNGQDIDLVMPQDVIDKFLSAENKQILYPRIPTFVDGVSEGSNAEKSGLLRGDKIIAVNGVAVKYYDMFKSEMSENKEKEVVLQVLRGEKTKTIRVRSDSAGVLGFRATIFSITELERLGYYSTESFKYSFLRSFPAGYKKAMKKLTSYIDQFALILSPSTGAYKGLGGFGSIGSMFPATWNWEVFWNMTAFLSLILAFMNVLPIPALDGGHVVFLLYEMIVGKEAPQKIMETAQIIGMILLLLLVLYANANDVLRLL